MESAIKISHEHLTNIFKSSIFTDTLEKCANNTYKDGVETGFEIRQDIYSDNFFLCKISKGNCDSMAGCQTKFLGNWNDKMFLGSYTLIYVHFHPYSKETIIPSDFDLLGIRDGFNDIIYKEEKPYKYETRSIDGIARINERKNIDVLLIQPKQRDYFIDKISMELGRYFDTQKRDREIIKILKNNNLNADLISYKRKNSIYTLENENKLKKFSFSPKFKEFSDQ